MKSERRHELQHNELADWLFKTGQSLKPYQNLIVAGIAIAVVAVAVYTYLSRTSASRSGQAWTDLTNSLESGSPEMLNSVAEGNPDTLVAQTAAVVLGDTRLATGCNQRFVSMAIAQTELNSAIKSYSDVLEKSQSQSLLERATFGIARAKETQGDLEGATQRYAEVVAKWPDGTYAAAAKRRLEDFKQPNTKFMFQSLREFEPKPSFSEEPGALGPQPSFSEPLPDEPPLGPAVPPKADLDKKSNGEKTDADPKK
jgi:hypothetical protein